MRLRVSRLRRLDGLRKRMPALRAKPRACRSLRAAVGANKLLDALCSAFRTKLAVWSNDPSVDSVGACIGPRGSRIQTIVGELKNEKIDIVRYSTDPVEYIVNALSPARIISVDILADDEERHEAFVIVPDDQLSLAIGREGQNVRLAHKLTSWKIDIKSVSQMEKAEAANFQNYEEPEYLEEAEEQDELQQEIEEEMNQQAYDEEDIQVEEEIEEVEETEE